MLVITHNSANWQKNQNDSLNQWRFKFKLKFQSVLGSRNTPNDNNNKNNDDNNDNNVAKCSAGNGKKKCQYEPILTSPPSLLPHILMTFLVIIDFTCVALNVLKTDNAPPPHAWAGPNKSWLTKTVFRTFCPAIQVSYCDCDCDSELKITLSVIVRIASYQLIVICIGYVAYGYGVSQKRSGSMFWSRPRNCRYSIPSQFSSSPGQMCLHCTFDQGWKYSSLFANPHITSSTAGWALLRNKLGQAVHTLVTTTIDHRHHRKYC